MSNFPFLSCFQNFQKRQRCEHHMESMLLEVAPAVRRTFNTNIAVTQCLSPLLDIIQPPLRAVSNRGGHTTTVQSRE